LRTREARQGIRIRVGATWPVLDDEIELAQNIKPPRLLPDWSWRLH
jgi:hypothetical protein